MTAPQFVLESLSALDRQHLDPVIVRIMNKVEPHRFVLEANTAHLLVEGPDLVVVALDPHTQVALVFAQFIGLVVVTQPGEFEQEGRYPVGEIDQYERAVGSLFATGLGKAQSLVLKSDTSVEVGHIDIEMVES